MNYMTNEERKELRSVFELRNAMVEMLHGIHNAVEQEAGEPLPLTKEQADTVSAQKKMDRAIAQLDPHQEAEKQMLCAYLNQAADELDALVDQPDAELGAGQDA